MDFDTLIHCDCIEYMKNMQKNSVDLTLTDIPYSEVNTNIGHNGMDRRTIDKGDADTKTFELSEFLPLVDKITKGAIVIFCGIEQVAPIFGYFKSKKYPTRQMIWSKTNPSVMNGEKEYLSSVENAVWWYRLRSLKSRKIKHRQDLFYSYRLPYLHCRLSDYACFEEKIA